MLSPSHKICSMCRRKLYVMQNTSSVLCIFLIVYLKILKFFYLIQGVVDHEGHDQLTTDAEGSLMKVVT